LVAHPYLGNGGSECAVAWGLQALAEDHDVTICTASDYQPDALNRDYGTRLTAGMITHLRAPSVRIPMVGHRMTQLQHAVFERSCRRVAADYDVCVSLYTFVDFGRPAIQRIADFSFDDRALSCVNPVAASRLPGVGTWFRTAYSAWCGQIRGRTERHVTDSADILVANSQWTAKVLLDTLGRHSHCVVYPPLPPLPTVRGQRDPMKFVMLGRVSPEKRIEEAVLTLAAVREAGHPVTLAVAGKCNNDSYGREVRALVEKHPWVRLTGHLDMTTRAALMAGATYGIHACEGEAFGIAVAEMMTSGLLVFVPKSGGVAELVPDSSLTYGNRSEAVARICAVLSDDVARASLGHAIRDRAEAFSAETYMERICCLVGSMAAERRNLRVVK
jgi:glycosyltransferase involved in cell wall biosynthesis